MIHEDVLKDNPQAQPTTQQPACCPTCGQALQEFSLRASGVLDAISLAQSILRDVVAAVEKGAIS